MPRRLPRLLAILTAAATGLAGIPLVAAALLPAAGPGACFCPAPVASADGGESRGTATDAEREEKEQEEDGDGKLPFPCGAATAPHRGVDACGSLVTDAGGAVLRCSGPAFSIRGPPAR